MASSSAPAPSAPLANTNTTNAPPTSSSKPQTARPLMPPTPYYQQIQKELRVSLQKRQALEDRLAKIDSTIAQFEKSYLEEHPAGNIIKGFDGYVKYTSGSGGGRRKGGFVESDRVFSRSSVSSWYATGGDESASASQAGSGRSTPLRVHVGVGGGSGGGGGVQTPTGGSQLQSALAREASGLASNHATPTGSTSSGTGMARKHGYKRSATVGEDSETDSVERKRARTSFGVMGSAGGSRK